MATGISYVDEVLEVTGGCTECSMGCRECWARKEVWRMAHNPLLGDKWQGLVKKTPEGLRWTGKIKLFPEAFTDKKLRGKNKRIFIDSKCDLFHPKVSFGFINMVINRIINCPQHKFFLLTKRIEKAAEYYRQVLKGWPQYENIHLGVTICTPDELWKAKELRKILAAYRWISFEPLLADMGLVNDRLLCDREPNEDSPVACVPCHCGKHWQNGFLEGPTLNCIDWVVVGCESGPNRRPCKLEWIRSIVQQCKAAGVKCYVKQIEMWGIDKNNRLFETKMKAKLYFGEVGFEQGKILSTKVKKIVTHDMSKFPKWAQVRETI